MVDRLKFPDKFRAPHPLGIPHQKGDPFGWFRIPIENGKYLLVMAVDGAGTGWDHVSVSGRGTPSWDEMCMIKDLFWEPEEVVVQFHPPKSEYVNLAKTCLHLWSYKGEMPRPPKHFVG